MSLSFKIQFLNINESYFKGKVEFQNKILIHNRFGEFNSLIERDMRAWASIFSESTNAGNRWEILSRDPPGNVFDIQGNSVVPYQICAMALEPGVYHVHTQLNVAGVGPGLGPGQTVEFYQQQKHTVFKHSCKVVS